MVQGVARISQELRATRKDMDEQRNEMQEIGDVANKVMGHVEN